MLAALALITPAVSIPHAWEYTGATTCKKERYPGTIFTRVGAYDSAKLTAAMCQQGCLDIGDPLIDSAGITVGHQGNKICLCGSAPAASKHPG